jgi:hemolysin III
LVVAVPLFVVLAVEADGAKVRSAVIVYAVGVCSMLAVSSTYHRWVHTRGARGAWRRADHSAIFAAIAGTFHVVALIVLATKWAVAVLIPVWAASLAGGVVKAVDAVSSDRIGVAMYVVTGWAGLILVPGLWSHGAPAVSLVLCGGVVYTLGAALFSRQWPRLRPQTFSYHEVWHVLTVIAAGAHFAAVWTLVS